MPDSTQALSSTLGDTSTGAESLRGRRVLVIGLGDLGRSPRMQYHALALADAGAEVEVAAHGGTVVPETLRRQPRLHLRLLPPPRLEGRHHLPRPLFLAYSALRFALDCARLLWLGVTMARPDVVLVQVPPSVPTLMVALCLCRVRGAKLVVDWHNFSYAQLALTLGAEHAAVRLLRGLERRLAPLADASLCVSRAMSTCLREWGVRDPIVLYDRPARFFARTPAAQRAVLLSRLACELDLPELADAGPSRPALLLSSTSWTPDEDFAPLLEGVAHLQRLWADRTDSPRLVVLVTGMGPLRDVWAARLRQAESARLRLRTLWLSPEEYALLLGAADLGLCFHRSASGVDLPMKVADMFGAGLPVCALNYGPCLTEIVRPGENGLLFESGEELAQQLNALLAGFPHGTARLDAMRHTVERDSAVHWDDEWRAVALSVFVEG